MNFLGKLFSLNFRYYFASDHIDKFMEDDNFYKQIIQIEEYQKIKRAIK
jgi:hypothetical protein